MVHWTYHGHEANENSRTNQCKYCAARDYGPSYKLKGFADGGRTWSVSEAALGRWCCNPEFPGSRHPPCHQRDFCFSVVPTSNPRSRFVTRPNWSASCQLRFLTVLRLFEISVACLQKLSVRLKKSRKWQSQIYVAHNTDIYSVRPRSPSF